MTDKYKTKPQLREHYRPLIDKICGIHNITEAQLFSRSRIPYIMEAKKALAACLKDEGLSYPIIGIILDRDHSSVMNLLGALPTKKEQQKQYYRDHPEKWGKPAKGG